MKRIHQILTGALVLQIIVSIAVFWPKGSTVAEKKPLFPDLKAEDVVSLTITDSEGKHLTLRRFGEEWILPEADDYPATGSKVTSVLEKLAKITTGRLVTRTEASHKRLKVAADEFVSRIEIEKTDGTKYTLYLGSSPRYGATHFRLEGQNETYLTGEISSWETTTSAASWIDTTYLNVVRTDLVTVTLKNAHGTFVFKKLEPGEGGEERWTMEGLASGESLAQDKLNTLLQRTTLLNMVRPLGKEAKAEYGMDAPGAEIVLETASQTVTLQVGAQLEDQNYVVKASTSPYYVAVSKYNVELLLDNDRDDFVQPPPTPTPTPLPTPSAEE